ncbi:transmembrane protein 45B-like [Gigantopelta aegis]|uniref:transmembrane protein 45B-like n=1 Tax=Gigantopelta aegis TaxID=1735272 RepID=UPI001B88B764|nr:transmembrane protein 45B-like [Gigantopelta aegis]
MLSWFQLCVEYVSVTRFKIQVMSFGMIQEGLLASGCFLVIIATWWLIQLTKRYYHSKQRHYDFQSSVTFPCCETLKKHPIEGFFKILSSLSIAIVLFCIDNNNDNTISEGRDKFLTNTEFGTLFTFMMMSGVMDVLASWSKRSFYNGLDYVAFMMFFAIEALILMCRSRIADEPIYTLYQLNVISALVTLAVIAMEMKYPDQVLCPLMRSYLVLVQGTWNLQVFYFFNAGPLNIKDGADRSMLLSMYFSWHCGAAFFVVLLMWILVFKLAQKNCCPCGGVDVGSGSEMVYLENRVRFDYHLMDRFESDID